MRPHDTFWSIPPIQDSLARHLTPIEFRACVLVSRALHDAFIPFLWRTVSLSNDDATTLFLQSPTHAQHFIHVRSLRILTEGHTDHHWLPLLLQHGPYRNLTSLHVHCGSLFPEIEGPAFTAFAAAHHSTLESFGIERVCLSDAYVDLFHSVITSCTQLRQLEVRLIGSRDEDRNLGRVLSACVHLEKLKLSQLYPHRDASVDYDSILFKESQIQDIDLSTMSPGQDMLMVRFMESCPRLVRIRLSSADYIDQAIQRFGLGLYSRWPLLEDLDLGKFTVLSNRLTAILLSCPSLKRVWLRMPVNCGPVCLALSEKHGRTLEYVEMVDSYALKLDELYTVANGCPSLKTLLAKIYWPWDVKETLSVRSRIKLLPWTCTGLEKLHLVSSGYSHVQEPVESISVDLFREIGQLMELEDLSLRIHQKDTRLIQVLMDSLENGGMKDLKKMKRFYFLDSPQFPMTLDQQAKVVECWPRLESFEGLCGKWGSIPGSSVVAAIKVEIVAKWLERCESSPLRG